MKMLFAVEAGQDFGLGHVMRCRALALEASRRGIGLALWLRGEGDCLGSAPWPPGTEVCVLPAGDGPERFVQALAERAAQGDFSVVVADGYGFVGPALRERVCGPGTALLVLDDLGGKGFRADFLLNQNLERAEAYAQAQVGTLLLGPGYALVSEDYLAARTPRPCSGPVRRVLITFGGLDRRNLAGLTVQALGRWPDPLELDVVAGPFYKAAPEVGLADAHRVAVHRGVGSLAPLMARCDLMIAGAGSTVWQGCAAGTPMIAVQAVDNQREVRATLERHGAALCLPGPGPADTDGSFARELTEGFRRLQDPGLRREMADRASRLVDGQGPARILNALFPGKEDNP